MVARNQLKIDFRNPFKIEKKYFLINNNNETSNDSSSTRREKDKIEIKQTCLAKYELNSVTVNNDFSGISQPTDPRDSNDIN